MSKHLLHIINKNKNYENDETPLTAFCRQVALACRTFESLITLSDFSTRDFSFSCLIWQVFSISSSVLVFPAVKQVGILIVHL